jgi:hypothetical protein
VLKECLEKKGIIVQPPEKWQGFVKELWADQDQVQQEIERRRRKNSTYTHLRQVKAEAEVALIVSRIRRHELTLIGHKTRDAFFLSHSRVVDNLPQQAHRVCMTPESLFEWILSVGEINEDDANAIYDQLLWEIAKEGVDVVPREQLLRLFHNTVDVSHGKLEEILSEHREIIREKYAVDPEKAFQEIDPLTIPNAAEEVSKEVLAVMQARLSLAEKKAKIAIKDKDEYERLKAEKKARREKATRKKRAARSTSGRKKGRR